MFSRSKKLEEQFKILSEDFSRMSRKISDLDLEIEKLKTHINSLRGLVNKKIFRDSEPESEEFKSIDGLDGLRKPHG